jgi:hypothetical protein
MASTQAELSFEYAKQLESTHTKTMDGKSRYANSCPNCKSSAKVTMCKCDDYDRRCRTCDLEWFWCTKHNHWVVDRRSRLLEQKKEIECENPPLPGRAK